MKIFRRGHSEPPQKKYKRNTKENNKEVMGDTYAARVLWELCFSWIDTIVVILSDGANIMLISSTFVSDFSACQAISNKRGPSNILVHLRQAWS